MYYYILGCGIACLILFGIDSMETVCVKPAEMVGKVLDRKSTRLNSSHNVISRMPSSA